MSGKKLPRRRAQGFPGNASIRGNAESEPEIPVTIAVSSELLKKSSLSRGSVLSFVKALKAVNAKLKEHYPKSEEVFRVILLHDNSSPSLESTIKEHELEELITLLSVTEEQLVCELQRNNTHLYLSAEPELKVQEALNNGIAAAIMFTPKTIKVNEEDRLHIAFDGDAVLFSNESERVFQSGGLTGYLENEKEKAEIPMQPGPFKSFAEALQRLQRKLHEKGLNRNCPIRTYLVTSRSAGYDGYRSLKTLHTWGLKIDEAVFLAGGKKGPTLEKINPHLFFDDQECHVKAALEVGIVACRVPFSSE